MMLELFSSSTIYHLRNTYDFSVRQPSKLRFPDAYTTNSRQKDYQVVNGGTQSKPTTA